MVEGDQRLQPAKCLKLLCAFRCLAEEWQERSGQPFRISVVVEELRDRVFIEKKLYPNIDFYSGITLKALGFPTTMFTVLFAVARTVGWIAQWKEMVEDPSQKIGRPRQLYTGATRRDYDPISKRR